MAVLGHTLLETLQRKITQEELLYIVLESLTEKRISRFSAKDFKGCFFVSFPNKYLYLDSTILFWKEPKLFLKMFLFHQNTTGQQGYWQRKKLSECPISFFEKYCTVIKDLLYPTFRLQKPKNTGRPVFEQHSIDCKRGHNDEGGTNIFLFHSLLTKYYTRRKCDTVAIHNHFGLMK